MKIRLTGAVLVAAFLPAAASAAQISPTVRVEGRTANVLPTTPVAIEKSGTATLIVRDTSDPDTITVPTRSATAHLATATSGFGLRLGFDLFDFGGPSSFVTQIGGDKAPTDFSASWRLKVNRKATSTGADATTLRASDSVLWSYGASFTSPELDLRTTKRHVTRGSTFQARVEAYDNDGVSTRGARATVRFAGTAKVANASGIATFRATRDGAFWVSATRSGAVRSQQQLVCVHPASAGNPCSAVTFPKPAARVIEPSAISGVVATLAPNSRVNVAVAKLVGSDCRFLKADRRTFSAARPCGHPITIPVAITTPNAWLLRITSKRAGVAGRLSPGRYRVWSRMASGTRRETRATQGINTVTFTVVFGGVYG